MKKVMVLCIVFCIIITGCGGKAKQIQNESEKAESVFNQEVNMSDAGDTVNESDEDFTEDNLVIDIDSVFSDGYAWVQANVVYGIAMMRQETRYVS